MSKRIVIVSGGQLDEELTLSILKDEKSQCIIGVDKGMEFLYAHQIMPSYIVGDFDSAMKRLPIITGMRLMSRSGNSIL